MSGGVEPLIRVTVARGSAEDADEFEVYTRRQGQHIELLPIAGALPRLTPGEQLSLRRPVPGDATYAEPVVVARSTGDAALVELAGQRLRHQQREHVRIDTSQLTMQLAEVVDVIDGEGDAEPRELEARVLDISAGGARIEHPGLPLPTSSLWQVNTVLHYEDGGRVEIEQVAEVRWALDPTRPGAGRDGDGDRPASDGGDDADDDQAVAGLRFLATRPGLEESVTRWVFQQQAKILRVRRDRNR